MKLLPTENLSGQSIRNVNVIRRFIFRAVHLELKNRGVADIDVPALITVIDV